MSNDLMPSIKTADRETKELPEGAIMHESVGGYMFMHTEKGVVCSTTNDWADGSGDHSTIFSTPQQAREIASHYLEMANRAEAGQ